VFDFGIAKLVRADPISSPHRTRSGQLLGTPFYMSPEQCRASRDTDHRTDVYSLGVMIYQMVTGGVPFDSPVLAQVLFMHISAEFPSLKDSRPELPQALDRLIQRAVKKDPLERWPTMAGLRDAMIALCDASFADSTTMSLERLPPHSAERLKLAIDQATGQHASLRAASRPSVVLEDDADPVLVEIRLSEPEGDPLEQGTVDNQVTPRYERGDGGLEVPSPPPPATPPFQKVPDEVQAMAGMAGLDTLRGQVTEGSGEDDVINEESTIPEMPSYPPRGPGSATAAQVGTADASDESDS
jgi:serine/threonine protein kinase